MRAVVYADVGQPPAVVEVGEPRCPDDGIVVSVAATGVCRSDWHAWRGHEQVRLPHTPGHEFAGTVAAAGPDVRRWAVGDRVTAPFVLGCGRCDYCRTGDAQVCPDQLQPGFSLPGSFAERVAVPRADANVVALPDAVCFAAAAALGCRFATAYRALSTHGLVRRGQWVVVHGCGGVGLSAVLIAAALGARVIAVDVNRAALAEAVAIGAELAYAVADDVVDRVRAATGGGAHVSLDALGDPVVAAASVACLRPRGRHLQVGLLLGEAATTALPMDLIVSRELVVLGCHGMPAVDYPAMLDLVSSGAIDPERLITSRIGLDEAGAALESMDQGSPTGITIVEP